jgi:23S rRNA (uracil-5-)-methyltransferase RumA
VLKNLELSADIVGILFIKNDGIADMVQGEIEILFGREYYMEELMGLKFKVSFYSFFQTNPAGAEVLYKKAMEYTGSADEKTVFDLFSGTGTIGQIASKNAKKVIGIEIVEDAVRSANENAKLNGIENCDFIAGDVFEVLDNVSEKPDVIIVDPPRAGIMEKTLGKILDYKVDQITYISCNPKTLVENLIFMEKRGYKVEKVCCVDMFPHTGHVETVVLMSRK